MSKYLEDLNPDQKAAVLHIKGPLAVIAGAGSGKTRMLTSKIAYLIEEGKIEPKRLVALTFTNKAANEMKMRIVDLIGEKGRAANISTYHSLCVKILRQDIDKIGLQKNFNIIDSDDQSLILKRIYNRRGIKRTTFPLNGSLDFISTNKMNHTQPDDAIKFAEKESDEMLAKIFKDYAEELTKTNSLDFDDLLIKTFVLLKNHPEVAEKWGNTFDYVLIDEFQDTSFIQYEIMKRLAVKNNITVVGDPDQTIYTWRQADSKLITNFQKYFTNSTVIKLEKNYRSTKSILSLANTLITKNKNRLDKVLYTDNEEGEPFEYYYGFSSDSEARWIVRKIFELRSQKNQLKDIMILYRSHFLSQPIEWALMREGINYIVHGGTKFYQRKEIKDSLSYLKIMNSLDEISFLRMVNVPTRGIGNSSLEKLETQARAAKMPIMKYIISNYEKLNVRPKVKEELKKFLMLIRKFSTALKSNQISSVLKSFLIEVNYFSIFKQGEEKERVDNVNELIKAIGIWEKNNPNKNLSDYLAEVTLLTESGQNISHSNDFLSLMTVHNSKGTEAKNVFVTGLTERMFPTAKSIDGGSKEAIEEERRLAYVAITRAKERLFLSSFKSYNSFGKEIGESSTNSPSRFIKEMGINVNEFSNEFINLETNTTSDGENIVDGDYISHLVFGEGEVLSVQGEFLNIKFKEPHGEKMLLKNHSSIERINK